MRFHTARQVIHDSFMPDVTSIDISAMILEFGVQFSAKGSSNKTMDHVEKGYIQQALALQKERDRIAWAWNMYAYTPPGTQHGFERSTLLQWMAERFRDQGLGNPFLEPTGKLMLLARVAMEDIKHEDVTGKRRRRKYRDLAKMLGLSEEQYCTGWHSHYVRFRAYCQTLPERSLPAIARVVWMMIERTGEDSGEALLATERLRSALCVGESAY